MYYKDPDGNLVELFFEHWTNDEEYKNEISARGFPEEPVGTNMDIDILYQMYKNGEMDKAEYEFIQTEILGNVLSIK